MLDEQWWPTSCLECGRNIYVAHSLHDWACLDVNCKYGHGYRNTLIKEPNEIWVMTDLGHSEMSGRDGKGVDSLYPQLGNMAARHYRFRALKFGRLIVTTCIQGTCHRIVDRAFTQDREGNRYESVALILRPWRRNEWGEYFSQRALVIGWRQ